MYTVVQAGKGCVVESHMCYAVAEELARKKSLENPNKEYWICEVRLIAKCESKVNFREPIRK